MPMYESALLESKYIRPVRLSPRIIQHGDQPVGITEGRPGVREDPDPGGDRQGVWWSPGLKLKLAGWAARSSPGISKVDLD